MSLFRFSDGINITELPIIRKDGKSAYQYAKDGGYSGTEEQFSKKLLDINNPYAIGSIYQSFDPTSPSELFGGTWEQLTEVFLLGASNMDLKNSDKTYLVHDDSSETFVDGGETTVAITLETMPSHTHTIWTGESGSSVPSTDLYTRHALDRSQRTHGMYPEAANQPHNNMPPYMIVYTWRRKPDNITE